MWVNVLKNFHFLHGGKLHGSSGRTEITNGHRRIDHNSNSIHHKDGKSMAVVWWLCQSRLLRFKISPPILYF